jgi:hypothetical protein
MFFFEKKNQKTFVSLRGRGLAGDRHARSVHGGHRPRRARVAGQKFFCYFFFKKSSPFLPR